MRGGPVSTSTSTAVGKQYVTGKNPPVAMILSFFIPGVGQFYNGDMKKGAVMLGAAVVFGALTAGLGWLAMAIWSAVDAYQVATGKSPLW
jgi:TM2 domain-containing membrane protein YozV